MQICGSLAVFLVLHYSLRTTHFCTEKHLVHYDLLGTILRVCSVVNAWYLHNSVSIHSDSPVIPQTVTRTHSFDSCSYLLSTRVEEITQSDNVTMIQLSHNLELSVLKQEKSKLLEKLSVEKVRYHREHFNIQIQKLTNQRASKLEMQQLSHVY